MFETVRGTKTDQWLPKEWRKCTFPVLTPPAKSGKDVRGSAFLIQYDDLPYVITAKHVIEMENPITAYATKDREIVGVSFNILKDIGLKWISHPLLDLAAIPFIVPPALLHHLDLQIVPEKIWNYPKSLKKDNVVAHLGYPDKGTSIYADGKPSSFPQGMPGTITRFEPPYFIMNTAGTQGASGGPVFYLDTKPYLVGVVIEAIMFGKSTRPSEAEYAGETKAIPISAIKDVLNSVEMNMLWDIVKHL